MGICLLLQKESIGKINRERWRYYLSVLELENPKGYGTSGNRELERLEEIVEEKDCSPSTKRF